MDKHHLQEPMVSLPKHRLQQHQYEETSHHHCTAPLLLAHNTGTLSCSDHLGHCRDQFGA